MNEFFSALYVDDMVAGFDNRVSDSETNEFGPSGSEFPIASPDSITVTTEFGVMEESGTITIISASGPSPHHQVFDNDTEDESNVEMTEDLNHELHASLSQLQLSTHDDDDDPETEHMQDVSDDEGDQDFDADAESAFIEEFMDDDADENGGMLTPTATAAA
jgi:hypothetical protein